MKGVFGISAHCDVPELYFFPDTRQDYIVIQITQVVWDRLHDSDVPVWTEIELE